MRVILAVDSERSSDEIVEATLSRKWSPGTSFKIVTILPTAYDKHHLLTGRIHERRAFKICNSIRKLLMAALPDCLVHIEILHGRPENLIWESAVEWAADKVIIDYKKELFGNTTSARAVDGSIEFLSKKRAPKIKQTV